MTHMQITHHLREVTHAASDSKVEVPVRHPILCRDLTSVSVSTAVFEQTASFCLTTLFIPGANTLILGEKRDLRGKNGS